MNLANKFQQNQGQQPQSNLQAQQILSQQLHQGQSHPQQQQQQPQQQQQITSNGLGTGFQPNDNFNDNLNGLYQNNFSRGQPNLQQSYFPQFQQNQQKQTAANSHNIGSGVSQLQQPFQANHLPRQVPHLQQQFYNQQQTTAALQKQQQQQPPNLLQSQQVQLQGSQLQAPIQKTNSLHVDNPKALFWQHQQQLCQISRSSNDPHNYARQYASNSRKLKNPYAEAKPIGLIEATKVIVASIEEEEQKRKFAAKDPTSAALLHNKKVTQSLDDDSMEEQRMRLKTQGRQLWCQLDLSGQGLVNLSPKLFHYDFLESLYLNNNKLTSIPADISKLRSLRTLDLSHNRLNELPPELGLCFNLRYLYLFDNNIKTLPSSFGNLFELQFIGVEGNPLDLSIANLIAEKGTKELIAALRDQKTNIQIPEPRHWLQVEEDGEVVDTKEPYKQVESSGSTFTLMSYNTLCQHYATAKMYKFTPSWALEWDYRRSLLEKEILSYSTDIICMQEVETRTYMEFWAPLLAQKGYKGFFHCKTRARTMSNDSDQKKVDGCATFYKVDKFTLVHKHNFEYSGACMGSDKYKKTEDYFTRFLNKDNIALISFLEHKETKEKICFVNTHLHWDPAFNDVKALQIGVLLEELQGFIKRYQQASSMEDLKKAPIVISGDFNSVKQSAVYQLFSTGSSKDHFDLAGKDYGTFTEHGFHHPFKLKSAYDAVGELPFTNLSPSFTDNIDYIWYSTSKLQVRGLLGEVDKKYVSHCIGFPDPNFPSDHVPILAKFQIKK
ncbi:CCR4 [Candida theae]|uniref:CCR4-Not complex 3'-5'-exoribonuclease subunit Ccr4 n=1 Tax=Candida theae TaxID=1198502 RepID=A0AAD5BIA5_9ASCO|nr:CCR4 [Candida theae]KAI5965454.1 CCR4 [Candida theae]